MCRLTLFFGAQRLTCRATRAVCEELFRLFAGADMAIIEGAE